MTEDTDHKCPLCGATRTRYNQPFKSKDAVVAHMQGSSDEDHKGVGYEKAQMLLDPTGDVEPAGAAAPDPDGIGDPKPDGAKADGGTDPSFSAPEAAVSMVELPCGHERFPEADIPAGGARVTCEECGDSWRVTP